MSIYTQNVEKAKNLVTRNENNIQKIPNTSFWVNDEKQSEGSNKIQVKFNSQESYLKIVQEHGSECTLFPIDGNDGVFRNEGLEVKNLEGFVYKWQTETGIEEKRAGDCDCLVISSNWNFIEFKTEATSSNVKQIENNRNKGEAQLAKTMTAFKESLAESTLPCICILVVPKIYPAISASLIARGVKFKKHFDAPLFEIQNHGNKSYSLQ